MSYQKRLQEYEMRKQQIYAEICATTGDYKEYERRIRKLAKELKI